MITKLYANDGKNIRIWQIEYNNYSIKISYGVLGGNLIERYMSKQKSKTCPQTAEKLIKDKLNEGYLTEITDSVTVKTDINGNEKPMLAQKKLTKIKYPAYIQPKYNGVRALLSIEEVDVGIGMFENKKQLPVFRSREGHVYGMRKLLMLLTSEPYNKIFTYAKKFDGELYIHGKPLGFIKSSCPLIRNGVIDKSNGNPDLVTYVIYDIVNKDLTQYQRTQILDELQQDINTLHNHTITKNDGIFVSPTYSTTDKEDSIIKSFKFKNTGYEGGIVRNINFQYQPGVRSWNMVKIKFDEQDEYLIIDVIPQQNDPTQAMIVCQTDRGIVFESTPMGNRVQRNEYLVNKYNYIGRMALIKYYELTEEGKPNHSNIINVI